MRGTLMMAMALVFAAPLVGCDGKINQCNRLIDVINKEQNNIKTSGSKPEDMEKLSKTLTDVSSKVTAVEVSDEKLKGFRDNYAKMATDLSKALGDTAKAIEAKDLKKIKAATENMDSFNKRESGLVDDINKYCRGE